MRRSSKNLPHDPNQLAYDIMRLSTEENSDSIRSYLSRIGRQGGLKGGKARADKLSDKRRHEIALKAANARWAKKGV
jgi:hypothetical protein